MWDTIGHLLFAAGAIAIVMAVVVAIWVTVGTLGRAESRDLNAVWSTATRHYKRLLATYVLLVAFAVAAMILFAVTAKGGG